MRIYDADKADEIYSALHDFVPGNNEDTKAAIILTDIIAAGGLKLFLIFYYYEEPEPPTTGPFAKFLEIDSTISLTSTRSYADLVSFTQILLRFNFCWSIFSNFVQLKTNGQGAELLLARIGFRVCYILPSFQTL